MRISAKGRYGLAAMISLAQSDMSERVTVISIAERLDISKIYLEQVFSLLKKAGLVFSSKGAQGGYQLAAEPEKITVFDILNATEHSLFEKAESSTQQSTPFMEQAMQRLVFEPMDEAVEVTLKGVSLYDLVVDIQKNQNTNDFMFYI